jgi:hypothetical protein
MSERAELVRRGARVALVLLLALAWIVPAPDALTPVSDSGEAADRVAAALDALPASAVVVVGFDPDVGTYAEIRPAVRALLADVLDRGARLVFVSLTPEGRALLVSELGRIEASAAGGAADAIVDLGFVAGAEAALVALSRSIPAATASGDLAAELGARGLGVANLIIVVGGNDLGPRTWIEQALPRIGSPPMVAVAPTVLLPELLPYVEGGQLDALLGTPIDGASYRAAAGVDGDGAADDRPVSRLALLLGMLVAIGALGHALGVRVVPGLRLGRRGDRA